jgi:hypothetical protein
MHSLKASLKVVMASPKANRALTKISNTRKAVVVAVVASAVVVAATRLDRLTARPNKALIRTPNERKAVVAVVASAVAAMALMTTPSVVMASFEGSNARRAVAVVALAAAKAKTAVGLLQDPRTTNLESRRRRGRRGRRRNARNTKR